MGTSRARRASLLHVALMLSRPAHAAAFPRAAFDRPYEGPTAVAARGFVHATGRPAPSSAGATVSESAPVPDAAPPDAPRDRTAPRTTAPVQVDLRLTKGLRVRTEHATFHLGFFSQVAVELVHDDGGTEGRFRLPFARPYLQAAFLDRRLALFVQPELASGPPHLLDLEVRANLAGDALSVRVGQFRPPTSRAWITPLPEVSMIGRGAVDDTFRLDRSLGAVLEGAVGNGRFDYHAGLLGPPVGGLSSGDRTFPTAVVRLAVSSRGGAPMTQTPALHGVTRGRFSVGAFGYTTRLRRSGDALDDPTREDTWSSTLGGDAAILTRRVHVLLEGFFRVDDFERSTAGGVTRRGVDISGGSQLQIGVFIWRDRVELTTRAGTLVHPDAPGRAATYQTGVALYPLGNHLRVQAYVLGCNDVATGRFCTLRPLRAGTSLQLWF